MPQPIMAIAALAVITIALIGQAIEMRKIRTRTYGDDSLCKKISQLKYDDEKRANEPRVVLEVDYN